MKDRIRAVRESEGASQADFAKRLGVSRAAVTQWESGVKVPSSSILHLIAKEFGVSEYWLLTGDGGMTQNYQDAQREAALTMFRQLPEDAQRAVNDVLEYYVKNGKSPYAGGN